MTVRAATGRGGLPTLEIECDVGRATLYLHGAHLTSWIPAGGTEVLFVSSRARFAAGESIRGGVPIAFPQFAELGPLPMHGFAPVMPWEWTGSGATRASLMLRDSEASRALWNVRFVAELSVELGANQLRIEFAVGNADVAPLQWTGTLHTFLALDARRTRIHGLGPGRYVDRGNNSVAATDPEEEFGLAGHTDRAYLDAGPQVMVEDGQRRLIVSKRGFRDTVVWNPGPETSARFADLGPEDHVRFVCVEAAEIRPVRVGADDRWIGSQILQVI